MTDFTVPTLLNDTVKIRQCTSEDVVTHFNKVSNVVPEEEHQDYKDRMLYSASCGNAYCVNDDAFIYFDKTGVASIFVNSIYGQGNTLSFIALLGFMVKYVNRRLFKAVFCAYSKENLSTFKSLATHSSVTKYAGASSELVVRCDHLRQKIDKIYKSKGVTWVVQ